jgi:hypothetical protein
MFAPHDIAARAPPNSRAPIADLHAYLEPRCRSRKRLRLPAKKRESLSRFNLLLFYSIYSSF